ncbi:MAG: SAM-dependent methyltransferase, partial [Ruminococcus sp.]
KKERTERLKRISSETRTVILYEAPHKLVRTLADLADTLGEDRQISLCRELTKIHEEVIRTTIGEAQKLYEEREPRGEYVLVIAGADNPATEEESFTLEEAAALALKYAEEGMKKRDACKRAALETGLRSNDIYSAMQS